MASKTPATGTRPESPALRDERSDALREYGQCAAVLRDMLYDDRRLSDEEFVFMDNHFQTVQMAYLRWKRIHALPH